MQIAKICGIRGSIVNKTAKQLTEEQAARVVNLMNLVWDEPELKSAKYQFCTILARTIKSEYKDTGASLQEVWLACWVGAVDALYHRPKKKAQGKLEEFYEKNNIDKEVPKKFLEWTKEQCLKYYQSETGEEPNFIADIENDRKLRIKWFKTYIYNRVKQIINENKIAMTTVSGYRCGKPRDIAKEILREILGKIEFEETDDRIILNTYLIPEKGIASIIKLSNELCKHKTKINITPSSIIIEGPNTEQISLPTKKRTRINQISIHHKTKDEDSEDGGFQDHIEFQIPNKENENDVDLLDAIEGIKKRLAFYPNALKLFGIMIKIPDDYIDKFGDQIRKTHLAKYLGLPTHEISRLLEQIRIQSIAVCFSPKN